MKTVLHPNLKAATAADRSAIEQLLKEVGLPANELEVHLSHFLVVYADGRLAGCAGMALYGQTALLRSLAVHPDYQGCGLGRMLATQVLAEAGRVGVFEVVLLTHTAVRLAQSLGFVETAREAVPKEVRESWEFRGDCCCRATCMRLSLNRV